MENRKFGFRTERSDECIGFTIMCVFLSVIKFWSRENVITCSALGAGTLTAIYGFKQPGVPSTPIIIIIIKLLLIVAV